MSPLNEMETENMTKNVIIKSHQKPCNQIDVNVIIAKQRKLENVNGFSF